MDSSKKIISINSTAQNMLTNDLENRIRDLYFQTNTKGCNSTANLFFITEVDICIIYCSNIKINKDFYHICVIFDKKYANTFIEDYHKILKELNTIYELSPDGIFVTDGDGITLRVNKRVQNTLGLPADRLIGKNVKELVAEGVFYPSVTLKVLEKKKTVTMMQNLKSGKRVIVTGTPVYDEKNRISRVISTTRDITELMELKEKLENAEELMKQYQIQLHDLQHNYEETSDKLYVKSQAMKKIFNTAMKIAKVDVSVLLQGESGVGKNIIAYEIHRNSDRNLGQFVEINCGAIPQNLLESELFGYEKGAFTGANKDGKLGLIQLADKGTLFLNEVGDLPLGLQVKLLKFLQEKKITRLGSTKEIEVDTRIIAATNKDLKQLLNNGMFREDLYYRLNVVSFLIPPLRERKEEIPGLLFFYLDIFNKKYSLKKRLHSKTIYFLMNYNWPGNVRELVNVVERLVVTADNEEITSDLLPTEILPLNASKQARIIGLKTAVERAEKEQLEFALKQCKNTTEMASLLGVSQPTIVRKLQKYNLKCNS